MTAPPWIAVLDAHNGAITAIATAVLAAATFVYVWLTWEIAASTNRQTQHLQEVEQREQQRDRATLWARTTFLLQKFAKLPERVDSPPFPDIGWSEQDERALEEAAAAFGAAAVISATEAARGLELMRKASANLHAAQLHVFPVPYQFVELNGGAWQQKYGEVGRALRILETASAYRPESPPPVAKKRDGSPEG